MNGLLSYPINTKKERMNLKAKIADTRHKIEELKNNNSEYEKFISAIRRFMQMDNLTSPLLRELIDHIDIFETEGTGKSRTQRIVIYYRFIGYIELPNASKTNPHCGHTQRCCRRVYNRTIHGIKKSKVLPLPRT
ncbi:MAG: DUF4368 domain-containing protein [Acutalibacteraceae bacterium]